MLSYHFADGRNCVPDHQGYGYIFLLCSAGSLCRNHTVCGNFIIVIVIINNEWCVCGSLLWFLSIHYFPVFLPFDRNKHTQATACLITSHYPFLCFGFCYLFHDKVSSLPTSTKTSCLNCSLNQETENRQQASGSATAKIQFIFTFLSFCFKHYMIVNQRASQNLYSLSLSFFFSQV